MSIGDIIGVKGTATVDVCDVERLMLQRDEARAERDRYRAALEHIVETEFADAGSAVIASAALAGES